MGPKRKLWFMIFFLSGVFVSFIDRAYYTMVFLPKYHGFFGNAAKKVVDVEGFLAFIKTVPGGLLFFLTIFLLLGAGI